MKNQVFCYSTPSLLHKFPYQTASHSRLEYTYTKNVSKLRVFNFRIAGSTFNISVQYYFVDCVWNLMAHGDAQEKKWRGNWRMEWVASTLILPSERGVSSINNVDAHTSVASSRLNWRLRRFKWTRPFRRKKKSGLCACAITFQTQSTLVADPINYFEVVTQIVKLDEQWKAVYHNGYQK
jgi:hypothetical protein